MRTLILCYFSMRRPLLQRLFLFECLIFQGLRTPIGCCPLKRGADLFPSRPQLHFLKTDLHVRSLARHSSLSCAKIPNNESLTNTTFAPCSRLINVVTRSRGEFYVKYAPICLRSQNQCLLVHICRRLQRIRCSWIVKKMPIKTWKWKGKRIV